jgi:hypothetical protein
VPKEITHWLIAEEVGRRISLRVEHPELLRLGAIVHDVLYYVRLGNDARCTALANTLHGSAGEDTFGIVRDLAEGNIHSSNNAALRSFLLGAVTHICADVIFHPFIYYAAGDFLQKRTHFQAWHNHRALESAIDLAFCRSLSVKPDNVSLSKDIHRSKQDLMMVLTHLTAAQRRAGCRVQAEDYWQGYTTLGRLRPLLANTALNTLLDGVKRNFPSLLRNALSAESWSYLGLRYSEQNSWKVQDIQTRLHYRHPVSGEDHDTSLQELFDTAVQESVRVWQHLEQTILLEPPLLRGEPLLEKGKSLEVGLHGVPSSAMRYFAPL